MRVIFVMKRTLKTFLRLFLLVVLILPLRSDSSPPALDQSHNSPFVQKLVQAALDRTKQWVIYNPAYFKISYPAGDLPAYYGVCTDVVIRSYRALEIDLQKEVHEDMAKSFSLYPKMWGLKGTDTNIDHRRVPNLMVFFKRKGLELPITKNPKDYQPGDIVTWKLNNGAFHIGLLVPGDSGSSRPWVVHNIGYGDRREDVLFEWEILGHYRYQK